MVILRRLENIVNKAAFHFLFRIRILFLIRHKIEEKKQYCFILFRIVEWKIPTEADLRLLKYVILSRKV